MDTTSSNGAIAAPLSGATAAALLIAVAGAVDFNKPLATDTDLKARLLGQINDSLYPFVVVITGDDNVETPYQVDNDGEVKGPATFSIENEVEEQPEVDGQGVTVRRDPVLVPVAMQRRVNTSKGHGKIIKLRSHEKTPFGVLLDSRQYDDEPEIFWALPKRTTFV